MEERTEKSCIDQEAGVEICGGSPETYLEVLKVVQGYGEEKRALIQKSFDMQDWKTYGNEVHAMKSSAAGIGAVSLSEEAKALEEACDKGDLEYIGSHQQAFNELLRKVLEEIDSILQGK